MRYPYAPGSDAATDEAIRAVDAPPAPTRTAVRVLTSARPYDPATPGTPAGVVALHALAREHGHRVRVTFALAESADYADTTGMVGGGLIASLAVRVDRIGFAVYVRRVREQGSAWTPGGVVLWGGGRLRPGNIGQLRAALAGQPYVPPPPRPPAFKVPCPGCGTWVSITGQGKIYSSHKCKTPGTETRS